MLIYWSYAELEGRRNRSERFTEAVLGYSEKLRGSAGTGLWSIRNNPFSKGVQNWGVMGRKDYP